MSSTAFSTTTGVTVPAVTASEMREVDRVAVETVGLDLLQMMENAGRNLAAHCRHLREAGPVIVLAGAGGNGGGGLACARHLSNQDVPVRVVLDREPDELGGAAEQQYRVLNAGDVEISPALDRFESIGLVVDALIGYGLRDAPRGRPAELIDWLSRTPAPILSLDVPSGIDATTGATPGVVVEPDRTLTLALPKTGLRNVPGALYLADIAIPAVVFRSLDIPYDNPFEDEYWVALEKPAE
ncbi:MAG: NAD(P)H-hydrate epimerase [Halobacteriales archaeon]